MKKTTGKIVDLSGAMHRVWTHTPTPYIAITGTSSSSLMREFPLGSVHSDPHSPFTSYTDKASSLLLNPLAQNTYKNKKRVMVVILLCHLR